MKIAETPNSFNPSDLQSFKTWNLITARNWYAQSLGFKAGIEECPLNCQNSTIILPENMLEVPLLLISASNPEIGCEQRNLTGPACTGFLAAREASLNTTLEQAALGKPWSQIEYCPDKDCEHDFVWVKPDYIYSVIMKYLPRFV